MRSWFVALALSLALAGAPQARSEEAPDAAVSELLATCAGRGGESTAVLEGAARAGWTVPSPADTDAVFRFVQALPRTGEVRWIRTKGNATSRLLLVVTTSQGATAVGLVSQLSCSIVAAELDRPSVEASLVGLFRRKATTERDQYLEWAFFGAPSDAKYIDQSGSEWFFRSVAQAPVVQVAADFGGEFGQLSYQESFVSGQLSVEALMDQAAIARETGLYEESLLMFRAAADRGHKEALVDIGVAYKLGQGVEPSDEAAEAYLRRAMQAGVPRAAFTLGAMRLENSKGLVSDEVVRLISSSASAGYPPAQYMLGSFFLEGRGVRQDSRAAVHWFRRAAKGGNAEAAYQLGLGYENGALGRPNPTVIRRWMQTAASLGSNEAQNWLDHH